MPEQEDLYCLIFDMSLCMPRDEWASWLEAIGTSLAVIVALWLARRDSRNQRLASAAAEAERLRALAAIGRMFEDACLKALEQRQMRQSHLKANANAEESQEHANAERAVEQLWDDIRSIRIENAESPEMASAMVRLKHSSLAAERALRVHESKLKATVERACVALQTEVDWIERFADRVERDRSALSRVFRFMSVLRARWQRKRRLRLPEPTRAPR